MTFVLELGKSVPHCRLLINFCEHVVSMTLAIQSKRNTQVSIYYRISTSKFDS